MAYQIRNANLNDFPQLKKLLDGYYQGNWRGSIERLGRDLFEDIFKILVAETAGGELVGFLCWTPTYDLNWSMKGGEVIDFYVSANHRGRGAALLLIIGMAAEIRKYEGTFLKGGTANPALLRSCKRMGMCLPDGECYISGRAFRHLAALSGEELREIVKNLPEASWNYEA